MPGTEGRRIHGLYVIIDPVACGERSPIDIATQAIRGGASVIQWRDKTRDKGEQLADARALAALCRAHGVAFIVNDHADLAAACNADGVHLGQHDLPLQAVRPILGRPAIVGLSTNNADEAVRAQEAGADYVAVGAIFSTDSKLNTRPANLDRIREIKAAVRVPVVAIGGITAANVADVVSAGADAAAVISAVCTAPDPRSAARGLARAFGDAPPPKALIAISPKRRAALHALVHNFVEALQRRDRSAFLALFAEDGVIQEEPPLPSGVGHDAIGAWWDKLMVEQPGYNIELEHVFVPAEEAALVWSVSHMHGGAERVARGAAIIGFDGNNIASIHPYWRRPAAEAAVRIAERYLGSLNDHDRESFLGLFAEEAVQQDPVGTPPRIGRVAISGWLDEALARPRRFHLSVDATYTSGDELGVLWTVREELDGKAREYSGVDVLALEGDLIGSVYSYYEPDNLPPYA